MQVDGRPSCLIRIADGNPFFYTDLRSLVVLCAIYLLKVVWGIN